MRTGEPGDYTFTATDAGNGLTSVEVTFKDDGSRWVTTFATDDEDTIASVIQSALDQGEFEAAFERVSSN